MLFKDYKKSYVEFCNEEIRKRIILEKKRYLRSEKKFYQECIINEEDEQGIEKIELIIGSSENDFEDTLSLTDIIENINIAKIMKLLSSDEQKVVSLRYKDQFSIEEIRIVLGKKRKETSSEICSRALNKIRKNLNIEK